MTDIDLAALEATARAATPGPWVAEVWEVRRRSARTGRMLAYNPADGSKGIVDTAHGDDPLIPQDGVYGVMDGHDAEHIAAFDPPTTVALITRLQEAEATIRRVESLADQWSNAPDHSPSEYDRGRVDQRHAMTMQLLEALAAYQPTRIENGGTNAPGEPE